jgi:hypothetical protein
MITTFKSLNRSLVIVVVLALLLRLAALLILTPRLTDDSSWYLDRGERLVTNTITPAEYITFGPLYAVVAGTVKHFLGTDGARWVIGFLQAILGALTAGFVWRTAFTLTSDSRIATVAGLGIALNPIFIIDSTLIWTEPLYLFFLSWGFAAYVKPSQDSPRTMIAVAVLFGLATLTRAQSVLFPLGLAIHLAIVFPWRRALRFAAILLVVYAAVVSTWTVYNLVKFQKLVIGASGISDFILTGAVGYSGANQIDSTYAQYNGGTVPDGTDRDGVAAQVMSNMLRTNLPGYFVFRVKELSKTLLQPHNTVYFKSKSLKEMLTDWLRKDRSVGGLLILLSDGTFWPKLLLYIAHFTALIFGVIGVFLTLRRWRDFAPLSGFIVYILLLHLFLLALPRYLYPTFLAWWVFAAVAIVALWDRVRKRGEISVRLHNSIENSPDSVVS